MSPSPVPARPPGRWGPAGGLPGGRCWPTGSPVPEREAMSKQIQFKNKDCCLSGLKAPVNPCEPGPFGRRPSCCWAPAAERSRSPVWPLETDSVLGGKWLCGCVNGGHDRCNMDSWCQNNHAVKCSGTFVIPVGVKSALFRFQGETLAVLLQSFLEAASLHQIVAFSFQQREAGLFSPGCAQKCSECFYSSSNSGMVCRATAEVDLTWSFPDILTNRSISRGLSRLLHIHTLTAS